jgi:sugar O-acyltransferase (sialic acid O-acetyltransferase NeuD family)
VRPSAGLALDCWRERCGQPRQLKRSHHVRSAVQTVATVVVSSDEVEREREALHLVGSGSFAVEVAEWAQADGWEVAGLIELLDGTRVGTTIGGHPVLAADAPTPAPRRAVVAAGGSRRAHWDSLGASGWSGETVVHPGAWVSPTAHLGEGCVVGPGAVVGAETVVGEHTLISRGVLVGHHARVGAFVSLLPGANVASHTLLGEATTVGMGAIIVDHTEVGAGAIVAAGAVVLGAVGAGVRVQGVPARTYAR